MTTLHYSLVTVPRSGREFIATLLGTTLHWHSPLEAQAPRTIAIGAHRPTLVLVLLVIEGRLEGVVCGSGIGKMGLCEGGNGGL